MNREDLIDRFLVYNRFTVIEGLTLTFIGYAYGLMISTPYESIREISLIGLIGGLGLFYILFTKKVRS